MAQVDIGRVAIIKHKIKHARQRLNQQPKEDTSNSTPALLGASSTPSKMLQAKVVGSVLLGKDRILKVKCRRSCFALESLPMFVDSMWP